MGRLIGPDMMKQMFLYTMKLSLTYNCNCLVVNKYRQLLFSQEKI